VQDAYFTPSRVVTKCGDKARKVAASGYIEERLKTLRCKLSPSKKAHKKHVFRKLLVDSSTMMLQEVCNFYMPYIITRRPQCSGTDVYFSLYYLCSSPPTDNI